MPSLHPTAARAGEAEPCEDAKSGGGSGRAKSRKACLFGSPRLVLAPLVCGHVGLTCTWLRGQASKSVDQWGDAILRSRIRQLGAPERLPHWSSALLFYSPCQRGSGHLHVSRHAPPCG